MICKCGLRRDHFACNACGMHTGVNNLPCIACHTFRFTAVPITDSGPKPELALITEPTASEPSQPKPQPATHARRARSAHR